MICPADCFCPRKYSLAVWAICDVPGPSSRTDMPGHDCTYPMRLLSMHRLQTTAFTSIIVSMLTSRCIQMYPDAVCNGNVHWAREQAALRRAYCGPPPVMPRPIPPRISSAGRSKRLCVWVSKHAASAKAAAKAAAAAYPHTQQLQMLIADTHPAGTRTSLSCCSCPCNRSGEKLQNARLSMDFRPLERGPSRRKGVCSTHESSQHLFSSAREPSSWWNNASSSRMIFTHYQSTG